MKMPNPDPGVLFIIFICIIAYFALVTLSALFTGWQDSVGDADLPFIASRAVTQSPRQIVDRARAAERNRLIFFLLVLMIIWLVIRGAYPHGALEVERIVLRLVLILLETMIDLLVALLRFLSTMIGRKM